METALAAEHWWRRVKELLHFGVVKVQKMSPESKSVSLVLLHFHDSKGGKSFFILRHHSVAASTASTVPELVLLRLARLRAAGGQRSQPENGPKLRYSFSFG